MAAVIPEAAEATTSGISAVRGARAARAAGAPGEVGQDAPRHARASRTSRARALDEAARPARPAKAPSKPPPTRGERLQRQARDRGQRELRQAGQALGRARVPGNRQYQPAILAEFLVAILITAVAPIAQGGDKTAQAKGGPSPYSGDTLKQLVAIGAAYFLLAILSGSRKYGRFAAWFGGLILLAVGLNSFVTGGLVAIFGIFGPGPLTSPADAQGAELGVSGGPTAEQIAQSAENAFGPNPFANPAAYQYGNLPGVTQGPPPGIAASTDPNVTQTTITPPVGGSGVITT